MDESQLITYRVYATLCMIEVHVCTVGIEVRVGVLTLVWPQPVSVWPVEEEVPSQ